MIYTEDVLDNQFFPFTGIPKDYEYDIDDLPYPREVALNFKKNEWKVEEDIEIVEGHDAVMVWVFLAIKTNRFKHMIFSELYGSEHESLFGHGFSSELIEEETFRYVKEALLVNPYIVDVENKGVQVRGDKLFLNIKVSTVYDKSEIEEMI